MNVSAEETRMRAYHFFMKFWRGFLLGFCYGWLAIFILAAALTAVLLLML